MKDENIECHGNIMATIWLQKLKIIVLISCKNSTLKVEESTDSTIFISIMKQSNRLPPSPSKLLECSRIKGLKALDAGLASFFQHVVLNDWLAQKDFIKNFNKKRR
ncbi:hypothetical protein NST39_16165 [Bacillus sp. FSL W8-0645]|uniref:hypothetical protein n=1 Tax=Bacillus sp. FSL W8-0645 TaxID=2954627 RepID=UPI0030F5C5D7